MTDFPLVEFGATLSSDSNSETAFHNLALRPAPLTEGSNWIQFVGNAAISIGPHYKDFNYHEATQGLKEPLHHPYSSASFQEFSNAAALTNVNNNEEPLVNNEPPANDKVLDNYENLTTKDPYDDLKYCWPEYSHSDNPAEQTFLPTLAALGQLAPSLETVTNEELNDIPCPLVANNNLPTWDKCDHAFNPENPYMNPELDRPAWTQDDQERSIARVEKWRQEVESKRGSKEMEDENIMCRGIWTFIDEEEETLEEILEYSRKKRELERTGGWDNTLLVFGKLGGM